MIGPKTEPIRPVPLRWRKKMAASSAIVIGMINGSNTGVATLSPSTALRTEIAGVITPSP